MKYTYFHTVILPIQSYVQNTAYTCGVAILRDILKTRGVHLSEKEVAKMSQTDEVRGTSPDALLETLDSYGVPYTVYKKATTALAEETIRLGHVCLVPYQAWPTHLSKIPDLEGGHWSIIFGFNKTHFFLADPAKHKLKTDHILGFRTIDKKRFQKNWIDKSYDDKVYTRWMVSVPLFAPPSKEKRKTKVKIVDGYTLRNTIDIDFGMVGDHAVYPYIPKGEIWIDQCFAAEKDSILASFLKRKTLMRTERYEKAKSALRTTNLHTSQSVHTKPDVLSKHKDITIRLVSGKKVRRYYDPSFSFGGHPYVYSYVPKKEIWIDDATRKAERKYIVIHEIEEYERMKRGMSYDNAHDYANAAEKQARRAGGVTQYLRD